MSKLPTISTKPYCCKPRCRNPGTQVEIVTGIGIGPDGEPIRRARVWCKWHGGHFLPLAEYRTMCAAQRVQEALLARAAGEWDLGSDAPMVRFTIPPATLIAGQTIMLRTGRPKR